MNATFVTIQLDPGHRAYVPGETLAGRFRWDVFQPDKVQSVELSVLWYTEGKGDEDFGVHYFEEHKVHVAASLRDAKTSLGETRPRDADPLGERPAWRPFATKLPHSPLSYDGPLVKIRWCVRVRVFLESGKDVVGEKIFRLGNLPSVNAHSVRDLPKPASPASPASLTDSRLETTDW
jgi:hypothetical protein